MTNSDPKENVPLPPTDRELATQAARGDQAAFQELVDRHAAGLFALAVRMVGNAADAEDVLQETFAGAFTGLARFRQEASVKTWLTQILVRQAARHHRSAGRRRMSSLDVETAQQPASARERLDLRADLGSAIAALSPDHREVILLRELQGMSYDQIADVLKVPRGTVESRLFRARRQLQEALKEQLE